MIYLLLLTAVITTLVCIHYIFRKKLSTLIAAIILTLPIISIYFFNTKAEGVVQEAIIDIGYLLLGHIIYITPLTVLLTILAVRYKRYNYKKILLYCNCLVIILLTYGYYKAEDIKITRLDIPFSHDLKICYISDLHAGSIHTLTLLNKLSAILKCEKLDLLIFGGDTIMHPVKRYQDQLRNTLQSITTTYGKFAIMGNHECYYGVDKSKNILEYIGINVLHDTYTIIKDQLCLLGTTDHIDKNKKAVTKILPNVTLPVLMLNHRPVNPDSIKDCNFFMCISGHTHDGQLFPNNLRQKHKTGILSKKDNTYFYISSGLGVSGAPFRIGTSPEIVIITLKKVRS